MMNMKNNNSRSEDDVRYTPNWISIDDFSLWDSELPSNDEDLYPELDSNQNPDYINQEKMRH